MDFSFEPNFSLAKIYESIKLKDNNSASNISGIEIYEKCFSKMSSDERICIGRMDMVPQPWSSISLSESLGQQTPQGVFSSSAPSPCLHPTSKHHVATSQLTPKGSYSHHSAGLTPSLHEEAAPSGGRTDGESKQCLM